jgi:hypothetical protein
VVPSIGAKTKGGEGHIGHNGYLGSCRALGTENM